MRTILLKAAVASTALLLSGCVVPAPDLDLSPVLRSAYHPSSEESETEWLVPFIASSDSPEVRGWALRPLMGYRATQDGSFSEFDFIPPFGRSFTSRDRTRTRFWPLYSYSKLTRDGGDDVDWFLLPILFGGHSAEGENYFAFFPLGGRIRNFISYDSFDFVLWPFFQRVTKKVGDRRRVSTSFLLLFGWTKGGGLDGSFHILPFYMKSAWKGRYRKYSVLWPFFHYQEKGLDTGHPAKVYALWPLVHLEGADNYYKYGFIGPVLFLGPLFQFSREVPDVWKGKRNTDGNAYYLYDIPWPIFRMEKTRKYERFRIFPLYSHYHEEDPPTSFDSKAFLIPFIWFRNSKTLTYERSAFYFIPLVTRIHTRYADGRGTDSYFQLWPLFHRDVYADGRADFSTLSLLPSRLAKPLESLERLFWPFWSIYRYQRSANGAVRHRFLFTLISTYSDETESRFSFPLLYNFRSVAEKGWQHNILWKLLTIEGDADGLKSLKLLFIPIVSRAEWTLRPQSFDS